MATQAQILANRQNSLQSTGPRTPQGKAAAAQNAFKSGLDAESQFCPGESAEAFAQLQSEYFDRYCPASPEERFQVDTLIRNEWMLRRLFRAEAALWEHYATHADKAVPLGQAFAENSTVFGRLQRRISAAERSYKEARQELERLQTARQPEPVPQLTDPAPQTGELASFLTPRPAAPPAPRAAAAPALTPSELALRL